MLSLGRKYKQLTTTPEADPKQNNKLYNIELVQWGIKSIVYILLISFGFVCTYQGITLPDDKSLIILSFGENINLTFSKVTPGIIFIVLGAILMLFNKTNVKIKK